MNGDINLLTRIEVTIFGPEDEDTFDDEPRAPNVSNCPPELLRRLVTSLSERAHNTLDCCDRLFACWIGTGDKPATTKDPLSPDLRRIPRLMIDPA